jgi:RNA polymerase sigma factor for flagellar operon FliA
VRKISTDSLARRARDDARADASSLARGVGGEGRASERTSVIDAAPAPRSAGGPAGNAGDSLLARYRARPSVRLRNQLIERYRGMVEAMAQALAQRLPARVDPQDLVHAGIWGLMQALAAYRPERGATFVGFMRVRVRGAMLDELRHTDRFARAQRLRTRRREQALERLRARLHREPSDAELAAELGLSERSYRLRFAADGSPGAAEDGAAPDDLPDASAENPADPVARADLLRRIEATLSPVEWRVLRLHYLEGMSGKDVARKLRLSPARVCQIHLRVLSRLKAKLGAAM